MEDDKQTALQILRWWALQSGAALADRVGEETIAGRWRERANLLAVVAGLDARHQPDARRAILLDDTRKPVGTFTGPGQFVRECPSSPAALTFPPPGIG